jgi:hypothetical protein
MRAAKLAALRSAVTNVIGFAIPVLPLIDIIARYAIQDLTVTQIIGKSGEAGCVVNCNGLKARLAFPYAIAVVSFPAHLTKSVEMNDEILIADSHLREIRSYSISTGMRLLRFCARKNKATAAYSHAYYCQITSKPFRLKRRRFIHL